MTDLLGEWQAWQRAANLSERTITERVGVLSHLCRLTGASPESISTRDVIYFLGRRGHKGSTRATYYASIKAFATWCILMDVRTDDPTVKVQAPKRPRNLPRPISMSQLGELLVVAGRPRTRMMILLGALAGLRRAEIARVHGSDISAAGIITVGKGGASKIAPAHELILAAAPYFPTDGYWFPAADGNGPVGSAAVGQAISRAMARAGIRATPHALRHFFGTSLIDAGVDVRIVQELMRHDSIQSTQIYTLVSQVRRQEAIGKLIIPDFGQWAKRDQAA